MRLANGEIIDFDVPAAQKNIYNIEGEKGISSLKTSSAPTICRALKSPATSHKLLNSMAAPCEIDVDDGVIINANETTAKPKLLNSMVAQPKGNQLKRTTDSVILTKIKVQKIEKRPQMSKPVDNNFKMEYLIDNGCEENQASETIEFYEESSANEDDQSLIARADCTDEHQHEMEQLRQEHHADVANWTQQLQDKETKIAELEAIVQRQEIELKQSQQRLESQQQDNKRLLEKMVEQQTRMDQKDEQLIHLEKTHKAQLAKHKKEIAMTLPLPAPQSITMTATTLLPKPKQDKAPLTKPQLFNGVRRYLNPSMVALLRMELFGDPEREYRPDEQEFSMELLNQSVNTNINVFDYMRSEWRFRLPPKNVVEQWIRKRQETDEGDNVDWDDC